MDVKELVPLGQAVKRFDRSEWVVRRQLRDGKLEGVRVGRDWFLTEAEVSRLTREYPLQPVTA